MLRQGPARILSTMFCLAPLACSPSPGTHSGPDENGGAAGAQTNTGGDNTSAGGTNVGGTGNVGDGGSNIGGQGEAGSGGVDTGGGGGGRKVFDDGDDSLNDVAAGNVCSRVAEIQCAAQDFCCNQPHSAKADCIAQQTKGCVDGGLDYVTEQTSDAFDGANAGSIIRAFEAKAKACDPSIPKWAAGTSGLRGLVKGTLQDAADCSAPAFSTDVKVVAAALASCENPDTEACLPHQATLTNLHPPWLCTALSGLDGNCFTDVNCDQTSDTIHGVYCNNDLSAPIISDNWRCKPRGEPADSCASGNQCQSLLCSKGATTQHPGTCLDATADAAYCLN